MLARLVESRARCSRRAIASAGAAVSFISSSKLDGQAREVVDEIERVLDFVGDAGGQLAERGHFLGLDQIGLRRLQIVQSGFGGVARGARFHFRLLPFAFEPVSFDQASAQHAERSRHGGDLGNSGARHGDVQFAMRDRSDAPIELS